MIYIIDFENVRNKFLDKELLRYKSGDTVYIGLENTTSSHLDGIKLLEWQEKGVSFKRLPIYGGRPSGTDMQLSSWAGCLFGEHPQESITLVSNDKGFKGLELFWAQQKKKLTVLSFNNDQVKESKGALFVPLGEPRQAVHTALQKAGYPSDHISGLMKILRTVENKAELQERCVEKWPSRGYEYSKLIAQEMGR